MSTNTLIMAAKYIYRSIQVKMLNYYPSEIKCDLIVIINNNPEGNTPYYYKTEKYKLVWY